HMKSTSPRCQNLTSVYLQQPTARALPGPHPLQKKLSPDVVAPTSADLFFPPLYLFEMIAPMQSHNFCIGLQNNDRILFNATNQIARHAFRQTARPHEHVNALGGLRQENRRLTG